MTSNEAGTLPTPTVENETRSTRVLWPVGTPDVDGYQTYAVLGVNHYRRHETSGGPEFRAYLRRTQIRRDGIWVSEKIALLDGATVLLDRTPAARFSAKQLTTFSAACRALVEQRYAEGDRDIVELLHG